MHLKFKLANLFVLILMLLATPVSSAMAQGSNMSLSVVPDSPAPYEDVSLSLSSYVDNLDTVLITWSVDGRTVLSGIGKKSFSLKAGAAASETKVLAKIFLPSGTVESRVTIRPSVMVLLWQANDSYIPPFYKGKAMPIIGSEIKIVAIPEIRQGGVLVSPKNMTYAWEKDYNNEQEASGYGKSSFIFTNDYLDGSNNVGVVAATVDQKSSSRSNIDIGTIEPKILFYKNDGRTGTKWEQALSDPYKIEKEEVLVAEPYFISPKDIRNPRLVFNWFINNSIIKIDSQRRNVIPLQVQEGVSGTSKLRLEIENKDKIFQTAAKEINVEF